MSRIARLGSTLIVCSLLAMPILAQSTQPTARLFAAHAMTHAGDTERGKALFFAESRLACSRCHTVRADDHTPKVGPSLFDAGDKFGRRDLIDAVLTPSASIAVGYSATTLRLRSGEILQGVVRESSAAQIVLMQTDGTLARLVPADVAHQQTSDVSLMPEGLQNGLTLAEFTDLIEYLTTLKLPESTASVGHGMPATIPEIEQPITLRPFTTERFEHPVWFGPVPGARDIFAVEEHETGRIWFLHHDPGGGEAKSLFVDTGRYLRGTRGTVGLVFHPRFAENGRYYFLKQLVTDGRFRSTLFQGEADSARTHDSGRAPRVVLSVDMSSANHYGGGLQFGPDGYLYIGIGDTGPQGDPNGNAQNMLCLAGKILRIDVDHPQGDNPYSIPADNPFVHTPGVRPEIWASGLRMAWRFSFDPANGDLWEGDVGQDLYEEVNVIRRGGNFGWNVYEGFEPYSNQFRREHQAYIPPIFAYTRKYGASVTGGFVYRGNRASPYYGQYIFGDYVSSRIFALSAQNGTLRDIREIGKCPEHLVSFGCDERGELYAVGYEGTIYALDLTRP